MDALELKTALNRANETQTGLAKRLGRSRSMVTDWIDRDEVPAEWVPLVYEALGLEIPAVASPLDRFSTEDLLVELLERERKSHES